MHDRFSQAIGYLPTELQMPLAGLPESLRGEITEIRLRMGQPMRVSLWDGERTVTKQSGLTSGTAEGCLVTRPLLDITFRNICSHSLHSCQNAIRRGFVTIAGGCRAGLCGTAVIRDGEVETLRAISGINLRIASERIGCAVRIAEQIDGRGGVLLCGPPSSGKTTILRDLARILSARHRICVMDERGELAASQEGLPQFDLGQQTDVFDGYPKAEGIAIALRVMTPQYLICDELGDPAETEALLASLHTGVKLIASAHAGSLSDACARPQIRALLEAGVIDTLFLLGTGHRCGTVVASEHAAGVLI